MAFNPDEYLASTGFNPDAYLGINRNAQVNASIPVSPGERIIEPTPQPKKTMMDYVMALGEVPYAIGKNIALTPISVAKDLNQPLKYAQEQAYQPKSPVSQEILSDIGSVLEASKLPPYVGGIVSPAMQSLPTANIVAQSVKSSIKPTTARIANLLRKEPEPTLSGVGAAVVPEAVNRVELARNLRVPGTLSKGQALRDLGQQRFEIETPKKFPELGKPLIEEQAKRNDTILQNFDAYVDATGKETFGLRETGKVVDRALVNQANKVKTEINNAYKAAREAGETQEPIDYAPLASYIENQTPTVRAKLAPILDAVDEQIKANDPQQTGAISINQLEDVYQFINKNYDPTDAVANTHVRQMKNLINQITEGKGGENYQVARALRAKYGREFENIGSVDKLLRTKKGTDDRAVAFEDVFKHSILDGSLDDVSAIGKTLKKAGPEGQQAWKDLQGQTIEYIKDEVTKSVDVDAFGNPVVSPAKFKSIVRSLDQDGKLDYLFGKKGAQEIRDLMEYTINVNAPLKGAPNYSNTASTLSNTLDTLAKTYIGKLPGVKYAAEKAAESDLKRQIQESINYSPESMAKQLRKGK